MDKKDTTSNNNEKLKGPAPPKKVYCRFCGKERNQQAIVNNDCYNPKCGAAASDGVDRDGIMRIARFNEDGTKL